MSNQNDEPAAGIGDDALPEDLQPTEDNPLAQPLTEEDNPKSAEELDVLGGGKSPERSEDTDPADDGHDRAEETDATGR